MNNAIANYMRSRKWWIAVVFYAVIAIFLVTLTCYAIFAFKAYVYNKKISELNDKIASYSTPDEKSAEQKVSDYKKKIDDFATIIGNHKISSNIFSFIETTTLPNVWFSSFTLSESDNEIRMVGEAENMEALSKQFNVFESSKDYVQNISVLNSQSSQSGRISFILNVSLNPKIFSNNQTTP